MRKTTNKVFLLLIDNGIDTIAADWNSLRDYCSETGKRGKVFVTNNSIPFGGTVEQITTSTEYFGEI